MRPVSGVAALSLFALCFAVSAAGQEAPRTPGSVAMLVSGEDVEQALVDALGDPNARVRAAAARVVNVRKLDALLPRLREVLPAEEDLDAAREEMRAIGMLGGPAELEFLIEQAERLGPAFRDIALVAAARVNGVQTLNWYIAKREEKLLHASAGEFVRAVLWGAPGLIVSTLSRALGIQDEMLWKALLAELDGALFLKTPLPAIALTSESDAIAAETAWHLVDVLAKEKTALAEDLLTALDQTKERSASSADLVVGREMLARSLGRAPRDIAAPLLELTREGGDKRRDFCGEPLRLFTEEERKIACPNPPKLKVHPVDRDAGSSVRIAEAPFHLLVDLPRDVANDVVGRTRCRDDWVGNVAVTVDRSGRVETFSLDRVYTSKQCKNALQHLIPLTLAKNNSIFSGFSTKGALVVKSRRAPLCVDEQPARRESFTASRGDDVQAPVLERRVEPEWSLAARQKMALSRSVVIIESLVSETGCVTPLQVVLGSTESDLNVSALLSIAQWRFKPGRVNGRPVPVIFNLTVNFVK